MVNPHWPQGALYLHQVHWVHLPCLHRVDKSTFWEVPFWSSKVPGPIYNASNMEPQPCHAEHYWAGPVVEMFAGKGACCNCPSLPHLLKQSSRQGTSFCRSSCASHRLHQVHGGTIPNVPRKPSWPGLFPLLHGRVPQKAGAWHPVLGHLRWHSMVQVILHGLPSLYIKHKDRNPTNSQS